jgi:hypothetical protein
MLYAEYAVAQLRHCIAARKVVGSIPGGVLGFFLLTYSFRPHYVP